MKKIRVALLFGGRSNEHDVSVASALAVARALNPRHFELTPIAISPAGEWFSGRLARTLLLANRQSEHRLPASIVASPRRSLRSVDVVFPVLHGPFGEDGTIQGMLELCGLPYVGSGVLASALGMNKAKSRIIFHAAGLPVPRSLLFRRPTSRATLAAAQQLGWPVVVKPNRSGSSIGVSIVHRPQNLQSAVVTARRYDHEILLETYYRGRELTVPVIGDSRPRALPVVEIMHSGTFFDLAAKYRGVTQGSTKEICPAPIPNKVDRQARQFAATAHQALGCRGLTRTDMILTRRGTLVVLEINTIPGLTAESLAPKSARAAGLSFNRLIERLIREALPSRATRRQPH